MTVPHRYDGLHRRTGYSATMGGSSHSVTFGYDGASRLTSISSGDDEATYTRVANAPLLFGLSRAHDSNHVVTTTWQHDFHNRLKSVSSSTGAGPVSAHEYTYDALGRRVAAELGDGSGWDYGYDAVGQVLSASHKRIVDESPVPGQQFAYTYDGIGNRTTAEVNGRTSVLSSNTLNQYTQRIVPGAIDVRGRALASAGVVVNDGIATRLDDAFHRAVPIDNSSGTQHPEVRVQALGAGAGPGGANLEAEEIGRVYLPGTPEVYSYDFDGNITGDGLWLYTWDFENRLVGMETVAGAPVTAKRKLEFLYDSESRRIRKRVYDWNGTAYVLSSNRRYLYDGWNLMAEIVASPTPFARTYVWGLDVSGSEQGAGGVGGLLAIREAGESHYPVYDGNGNVMALVRGSDEAISGRYHYGAFGEVLEVEETGISNPFRFSTKFEDGETGLLYYGFRYYSAETGRWLNRDPIEEEGGINLYGFVGNDGVRGINLVGEQEWTVANTWSEHIKYVTSGSGVGIAGHVRPSDWVVTWNIEEVDSGCYFELKVTNAKGSVVGNIGAPYKAAHELAHAADYKQSWSELLDFGVNAYNGRTASCRAEVECYGELIDLYRKAAFYRGIIRGLSLHATGRGAIRHEPAYVIAREASVLSEYQTKELQKNKLPI